MSGVLLHPDTRDPQIVMVLKDRMTYVRTRPVGRGRPEGGARAAPGRPELLRPGRGGHDLADRVQRRRRARSPTSCTTAPRRPGGCCSTARPALSGYELAPMEPFSFTARDGLVIHGYVTFPPGLGRTGAARGGRRARRAAGPRRLGVQPGGAVARQPGLPVRPGELPGLHRVREGVRRRRGPRVGRQDARRPGRRRRATSSAQGWADRSQGRHLRRVLRRVRGAGGGGVHAGRVLLRRGHRRARPTSRRCSRPSRRTGRR